MSLIQACVTATTTMLAVLIGGWLTVRAQDRLWRRDQDRQWRDIRLSAYTDFIGAVREYVAHVLHPAARITAVPRPRGRASIRRRGPGRARPALRVRAVTGHRP
ncbi:hypothetical protein [Micromonospora sp. NPDC005710]|uniref:hypothetical protein n=1 Tax=Micromonospora sp. NPDC005710 TaxID=3157051 RepID=UPI0033F6E493